MIHHSTFFPHPAEKASIITVHGHRYGDIWYAMADDVADHFGCDANDLDIECCSWLDGERFADFITLNGRVIGSLDDMLTEQDWQDFAMTRDDAPERLIRDTIAAARARTANSIH